jgi:hypothetical protein
VLGVLNAQRPAGGVLFAPRVAAMRALPSPD